MEKISEENRYPHSADLFKFCKEALSIKHNFEVKVIDQHVGSILGYDPADCSHWKKGKKNIKSLQTINTIADHLSIDSRLISDIVSGKMDLEESIQEYKGFGPFSLSPRYYDDLKREYFKNPSKYSSNGQVIPFESVADTQRETSQKIISQLLAEADVQTVPVLIPELSQAMPQLKIIEGTVESGKLVSLSKTQDGKFVITHRAGEMKPHIRFLIAREIGRVSLYPENVTDDSEELTVAATNVFAMLLLLPTTLMQIATSQADVTRDLVQQLSEMFWVSRSVVNARLKDFFQNGN